MSDAEARGWGPGWPTPRVKDMAWITVRGVTMPNGVHKLIAPIVTMLLEETMRRGYALTPGWCWGYANRPISGSATASNHSWGLAVDLNAPTNPHRRPLTTDMPRWLPELWETWGFRWGGSYTGKPDAMHYEFMGSPTDARHAAMRLEQVGTIEEAQVVRIVGQHISTALIGKGYVATNELGEVYAWQTADHGGYNRLKPEQRLGDRKIIGIHHDTRNAPDGYCQVGDDGAMYLFPVR